MNTIKQFLSFILIFSLLSSLAFAEDDEPSEGQIAPDFEIMQMDGTNFKLSDYRGKQSVYLVFWNTWCTFCMKKIPKLKQAQTDLNNQIKIIAVNTGLKDSIEKSILFKKQFNINYPLAFDHGKKVTDLYGVWGTPTEFIIDINGIIQHRDGVPEEIKNGLAEWNRPIEVNQINPTEIAENKDCEKNGAKFC